MTAITHDACKVVPLVFFSFYTPSSRLVSSRARRRDRPSWIEIPVRIPSFCLCGTVGIHTQASMRNPTKKPSKKPHKKSRSVPMEVRNSSVLRGRDGGNRAAAVVVARVAVLLRRLVRNSDVSPCVCIQASSCINRRRRGSDSSEAM